MSGKTLSELIDIRSSMAKYKRELEIQLAKHKADCLGSGKYYKDEWFNRTKRRLIIKEQQIARINKRIIKKKQVKHHDHSQNQRSALVKAINCILDGDTLAEVYLEADKNMEAYDER